MIDSIIAGWWKVLALLAGLSAFIGVAVLFALRFIKGAKESGVDEITAGPVKLDFEDDKK